MKNPVREAELSGAGTEFGFLYARRMRKHLSNATFAAVMTLVSLTCAIATGDRLAWVMVGISALAIAYSLLIAVGMRRFLYRATHQEETKP